MKDLLLNARNLRKSQTKAETLLWFHFRAHRFGKFKFKRQQPLGPYIVDFVCLSKKIIIEVDGGQHTEQLIYDSERTRWLEEKGYSVLRFWNNQVLGNTEIVLQVIFTRLNECPSPGLRPPSPQGGGNCPEA